MYFVRATEEVFERVVSLRLAILIHGMLNGPRRRGTDRLILAVEEVIHSNQDAEVTRQGVNSLRISLVGRLESQDGSDLTC
jgi:hypothetical protein